MAYEIRLSRDALVPVDESDQEVLALRSNSDFMAYLDESKLRARKGPTKSLEEIKKLFSTEGPVADSRSNEEVRSEGPTS